MANPINAITTFFMYYYDSTIVLSDLLLNTSNTQVTGREITIQYHPAGELPKIYSIRTYYNGHDILNFTIQSLLSNAQNFYALKNDYFSSINIY